MNLTVLIESAELKYKQILEDVFISDYDEDTLPSHGLEHHRRVWSYAKELLLTSSPANFPADPEKLIIACYLHDIGMSSDPGPSHGMISRNMCLDFLLKNGLDREDFTEVLETIHRHDRKNYTNEGDRSALLKILSLADDLDAFGFTGIYRYAEIYLLREVDPSLIGYRVLENAALRFGNLRHEPGLSESLVNRHRKRYQILENFYSHYNRHAKSYDFDSAAPEGHCGLIQLIHRNIRNRSSLKTLLRTGNDYRDDVVISAFFEGFKNETGAS